ncbi:D-arabitol-phosphate dehydrogenase [Aquisphaera giovannonii]|uniref:D-arabitol-phosphate dehydrogenase n=1 Tax=Aquisphaera giovannonii TaxID=406548 RepID=A0A5B9W0I4_9BACT|nr:zinc-binding dehydrogenase [Aquisphaera giovannonii]QEH34152.1 D-arabitol-phosphate dehydrogenase [Aquisphaera giovannonii]
MSDTAATMTGVVLPGNSTVEFQEYAVPEPGHGQVLVRMKASSICGSDIRAIYREHLGKGPEGYQNVIAGHEPCGQVVKAGPGCKRFRPGDRVVIYHISGCGVCDECQHGYMISCRDGSRAAYGWQRDGGHAPYLLAEENTCIRLPDSLSYIDGALCACGFGTAYEALRRMQVSGQDRLLITGMGPVGLAAAMLGRALGASTIIGTDLSDSRLTLATELGLVDVALRADDSALDLVMKMTGGHGCEASIDCSGAAPARLLALQGTRDWGRCAFVGEGGTVSFDVSKYLIHKQITLFGSWVTSLKHMEELVERLDRWGIHPDRTCTVRLPLAEAAKAYELAAGGQTGKVCIVHEE